MDQMSLITAHAKHKRIVELSNTSVKLDHNGKRAIGGVCNTFKDWSTEQILKFLKDKKFQNPRQLDDGSWCAIYPLLTTYSVCTDITYGSAYAYRWCFKELSEATKFLEELECFDDVPVNTSSLRGHRYHDLPRMVAFDELGFSRW